MSKTTDITNMFNDKKTIMTNTINIDKTLDKYSKDFSIRHTGNRWALLSIIVCIVPFIIAILVPSLRDGGFYDFAVTMLILAATIALCLVIFYVAGDSKKIYFKPSHDWMERCEFYFDGRNLDKIAGLLAKGDFQAIADMPRNHSQQYLIIMYKAPKGNVVCAQICTVSEMHFKPCGDIVMLKDGEHNIPKKTSLLDFFYQYGK